MMTEERKTLKLRLVVDNPAPAEPVAVDPLAFWAPQLHAMTVGALARLHIDMLDVEERELVLLIQAEFTARGLDPLSLMPLPR